MLYQQNGEKAPVGTLSKASAWTVRRSFGTSCLPHQNLQEISVLGILLPRTQRFLRPMVVRVATASWAHTNRWRTTAPSAPQRLIHAGLRGNVALFFIIIIIIQITRLHLVDSRCLTVCLNFLPCSEDHWSSFASQNDARIPFNAHIFIENHLLRCLVPEDSTYSSWGNTNESECPSWELQHGRSPFEQSVLPN